MGLLYIAEFTGLVSMQQGDSTSMVSIPPIAEQTVDTTAYLSVPIQSPLSTTTTGGSIPAATYYVKVTGLNVNGETTPSNERSITTTGTTSTLTITWGDVGADEYKVYIGTISGAERLLEYTLNASVTITALPTTTGSPPAGNTTANSVPLNPSTQWVEVSADSACSVAFGPNAKATPANCRLAPNERILRRVNQGGGSVRISAAVNS